MQFSVALHGSVGDFRNPPCSRLSGRCLLLMDVGQWVQNELDFSLDVGSTVKFGSLIQTGTAPLCIHGFRIEDGSIGFRFEKLPTYDIEAVVVAVTCEPPQGENR